MQVKILSINMWQQLFQYLAEFLWKRLNEPNSSKIRIIGDKFQRASFEETLIFQVKDISR